jgi:predicted ATP-grasp superfamily ATP-dependent carboligase
MVSRPSRDARPKHLRSTLRRRAEFGGDAGRRFAPHDVAGHVSIAFHRHGRGGDAMPFLYAGSFGPVAIDTALAESLVRIGREVHDRTGLVGLCNVDVIVDRSGHVWLLEINPRWSGSSEVIERSLVGDATNLFAIACDPGLASSVRTDPDRQTYKRVLFAPLTGRNVTFQLRSVVPELGHHVRIADVPADGTSIEPGWPICTVLVDVGQSDPALSKSVAIVRSIRDRIVRDGC